MLLLELFNMLLEGKLENYAEANADTLRAVLLQQSANTSVSQILSQITQIDPSNNKSLSIWLLKLFINKDFTISEFPKVSTILQQYQVIKSRLENFDPTTLTSISQLESKINNLPKSNALTQKEYAKNLFDTGQIKIVQTVSRGKVYEVHSEEAMKWIGKNTKWCVAAQVRNMFQNYYRPTNPIFVFIDKTTHKKYCFDRRSNSLNNELNVKLPAENPVRSYMEEHIDEIRNNLDHYAVTAAVDDVNDNIVRFDTIDELINSPGELEDFYGILFNIDRMGNDEIGVEDLFTRCVERHRYMFVKAIEQTFDDENLAEDYEIESMIRNNNVLLNFFTNAPDDLPDNLAPSYNSVRAHLNIH